MENGRVRIKACKIKEQAEQVLDQLGIPMSDAVSMFLRQVVLQRGIPFEIKLPEREIKVESAWR